MTKAQFMNNVSRKFHRIGFKFKKHSPEILLVTGIVSGIAGAIVACKATTKLGDVLEETKENLAEIKYDHNIAELTTDKAYKRALTGEYIHTGIQLVKLYAPAVTLGGVAVTSILASHNLMRGRNAALAAAYATVDNSFKDYRNRVIERFGEKVDRELKYNIKAQEVEEVTVDENGETQVTKKVVEVADFDTYSQYSRIFDETCAGWVRDADQNKYFLLQVQKWANYELKRKGMLFLNEVYEKLGFDRTMAGQEVGWVYDPENPEHQGDNHVDLGIYDCYTGNEKIDDPKRAFINGIEKSIIVDFNVDGPVHHLLA